MELVFLILLFIIAFLYSSVGHGGASGYLALMAIFSISPVFMKSSALLLNIFVSGISFYTFYKAGFFKSRLIIPFLITSIPASYMGARMELSYSIYKIILALFLFVAIFRIIILQKDSDDKTNPPRIIVSLLIGGILGFVSGMIGIGGGIILSPLLIVFRWATIKESAAAAALFIVLNSISGLTSLFITGFIPDPRIYVWVIIGIVGAIFGSYFGSLRFNNLYLRYILSLVLLLASLKLIWL